MKRALLAAMLWSACAVNSSAPSPTPARAVPRCPSSVPQVGQGEASAAPGKRIGLVCLLGASDDARLRLFEKVAVDEGQPLSAALVRNRIEALTADHSLSDVAALVEPIDAETVMLLWSVAEYPRVERVRFEGLSVADEGPLRDVAIKVSRGNPVRLREASLDMQDTLRAAGFAEATVAARVDTDTLVVTVHEGPRTTIGAVKLHGQKVLTAKDLPARTGQPFQKSVLDADAQRLKAVALDRGLIDVEVTVTTAAGKAPNSTDVTFEVLEGPVFTLGTLSFKGQVPAEAKALMQRFESKPGKTFNRSALARDLEKVTTERVKIIPLLQVNRTTKRVDVGLEVVPR